MKKALGRGRLGIAVGLSLLAGCAAHPAVRCDTHLVPINSPPSKPASASQPAPAPSAPFQQDSGSAP